MFYFLVCLYLAVRERRVFFIFFIGLTLIEACDYNVKGAVGSFLGNPIQIHVVM